MSKHSRRKFLQSTTATIAAPYITATQGCAERGDSPDTVFYNCKVITVDSSFSIAEAVAIKGNRILAVGSESDILSLAGNNTKRIDLEGRTVVPGLIEGHAHPENASLSELEQKLPNPRTVDECLDWVREQAGQKDDGEWIIHPKLFPTRLAEIRAPSLAELDSAAPSNPVFLNASYGGVINTSAMKVSGIDRHMNHPGLLKDPVTGNLSGRMLNTATSLLKLPPRKSYEIPERAKALAALQKRYNSVGFTSVTSGGLRRADAELYRYMFERGMLSLRVYMTIWATFPFAGKPPEEIARSVADLGPSTGNGDDWLRTGPLKTTVDGGILTGTAYLREPWGKRAAEVYGHDNPDYRGYARVTADEYAGLVRAGAKAGWKMTAHCTGGGGVDLMLDAYEQVNRELDLRSLRCSIIHGNFYTPEAMEKASRLNVIADSQPAWFYKDADIMLDILGRERIKTFHPYRSLLEAGVVVSAGSDHMVILDDKESINPYNPWLAMYSMITRKTERGSIVVPEEAITREQTLRCYTVNNAYASFEENSKGSIEPGKLADMVIVNEDFLNCHEDAIQDIRPVMNILDGKTVYSSGDVESI